MKVIYVTGAPAAGKSSTLRMIQAAMPTLLYFEYGAELTKLVQKRDTSLQSQDELRTLSAGIVTPDDVNKLDDKLIKMVAENRLARHILIDSHPVTKEDYGFRITAFTDQKVRTLRPDEIWVFFVDPLLTRERIRGRPAGRPLVTEEDARLHTIVQASIAASYGIISGAPVYLFDTNCDQAKLVQILLKRLEK